TTASVVMGSFRVARRYGFESGLGWAGGGSALGVASGAGAGCTSFLGVASGLGAGWLSLLGVASGLGLGWLSLLGSPLLGSVPDFGCTTRPCPFPPPSGSFGSLSLTPLFVRREPRPPPRG